VKLIQCCVSTRRQMRSRGRVGKCSSIGSIGESVRMHLICAAIATAAIALECAAQAPQSNSTSGALLNANNAVNGGSLHPETASALSGSARPENSSLSALSNLTAEQIVDRMQQMNQARLNELQQYKSVRHYQVDYHGFSFKLAASMDVEVSYDAQRGKTFRILGQQGSKALCEKVLKRAVDSEQEAQQDKTSTALAPANYRFRLDGIESPGGRNVYVLDVEPLVKSKFLYRGKIWVDAEDFALVRIEAEPAKNPSFWISRTLIHQTYAKTGNYWLPAQNHSETQVRIGGAAVFDIDYGKYQIASNLSN
jgi:hypothetical protein